MRLSGCDHRGLHFLEQGYRALLAGEYDEAMAQWSATSSWNPSRRADPVLPLRACAHVAAQFFYDPVLARNSFKVLREQNAKELKVHEYTRLMRQSLLNLLQLQDKIDTLKAENATKDDLKKREEALAPAGPGPWARRQPNSKSRSRWAVSTHRMLPAHQFR